MLAAYRYEADGITPTTHMLVIAIGRKAKAMGTVHCQPPKHAQEYAAQPFFHELLHSSPDLIAHEFIPLSPSPGITTDQASRRPHR